VQPDYPARRRAAANSLPPSLFSDDQRCANFSALEQPVSKYHLAQVNIAQMKASLDGPLMAGFVARLNEINAVADASPGFVWRLQTDGGNATSYYPKIQPSPDREAAAP
jgi:hypothetical protein